MRYILLGAPHALKDRKIFSVNTKPRNAVPIRKLNGNLFDTAQVYAAAKKLEFRGDRGVFFSKHGEPYVMQRIRADVVAYAPRRVWTSMTFLAREYFRATFNTKTNPGEINAVLLMQGAPKDRQFVYALGIKSTFQASLLIDSCVVTETDAYAHFHQVANLVDKEPYEKGNAWGFKPK